MRSKAARTVSLNYVQADTISTQGLIAADATACIEVLNRTRNGLSGALANAPSNQAGIPAFESAS